jgi:FkbM family methyltransferase
MNYIERIMNSPEVASQPPILLDIGASEGLHPAWRSIARYSICIAFDPDAREFSDSKLRRYFRQLHSFNCVVSDVSKKEAEFFLTHSPYCSSLLEPDLLKLKDWAFAPLFTVEKKNTVKAKTLPQVLQEVGLHRVDWFKVDSQGMDLRLFKSLKKDLYQRVLAAEFEPGIIDAYKGEDKLHEVLRFMETLGFWLADITIKGSQRISPSTLKLLHPNEKFRKLAMFSHKASPGWAELVYLNTFQCKKFFTKREYLLGWLFATLQQQYGFAYQLAQTGQENFDDPLFFELLHYSERTLKRQIISPRLLPFIQQKFYQMAERLLRQMKST